MKKWGWSRRSGIVHRLISDERTACWLPVMADWQQSDSEEIQTARMCKNCEGINGNHGR